MKVRFYINSFTLGSNDDPDDDPTTHEFEMEVPPEHEDNFRTLLKGMRDFEDLDIEEVEGE